MRKKVCELQGVKASSQIRDKSGRGRGGSGSSYDIIRLVTMRGREEGEGLRVPCGVTSCRGLEPAITRLWGKGVSITLARMDQLTYNLDLDL